jgi:ABC-type multidrug transport system fused ATPase/permease subunit
VVSSLLALCISYAIQVLIIVIKYSLFRENSNLERNSLIHIISVICLLLPFIWPLPVFIGIRSYRKLLKIYTPIFMIRIEKLHVAYGNHQVLKGLSMHVQTGTIHGLVGLNGSGKTTLLNTLYGIMKQKTGTIELEGQKSRRQAIGYLETQQYFYPPDNGNGIPEAGKWHEPIVRYQTME